jgi:Cu2+-exporting ATPase
VDYVVFDKTATLTLEQPCVGNLYPCGAITDNELMAYAAAAEYRQTHPIARAIRHAAAQRQVTVPSIDDATYDVGYGMKARVADQLICVGSARFMTLEDVALPDDVLAHQERGHAYGYSFVYVAVGHQLAGCIELHAAV